MVELWTDPTFIPVTNRSVGQNQTACVPNHYVQVDAIVTERESNEKSLY